MKTGIFLSYLAIKGETRAVKLFKYIFMLEASTLFGAHPKSWNKRDREVLAPASSLHQVP
jgi:hypothetical protein